MTSLKVGMRALALIFMVVSTISYFMALVLGPVLFFSSSDGLAAAQQRIHGIYVVLFMISRCSNSGGNQFRSSLRADLGSLLCLYDSSLVRQRWLFELSKRSSREFNFPGEDQFSLHNAFGCIGIAFRDYNNLIISRNPKEFKPAA